VVGQLINRAVAIPAHTPLVTGFALEIGEATKGTNSEPIGAGPCRMSRPRQVSIHLGAGGCQFSPARVLIPFWPVGRET
jgi:hypothetical protein